MSIGELFIELGVVGNPEQVEKFNKKIKETAKSMDLTLKSTIKANGGLQDLEKGVKAFTTALKASAIIGVIKTIDTLTQSLISNNQAMLDLTRTSDIALGTFQKWGSIGKMLGVNNVEQQLEGLNQRMFDLMLTGQGARGFQLAGINPIGQDAEGVLEQLRNRVSGMNDTTATYLLQQMGLDPKMLHLLRMSRTEFEELGNTIKRYQLTDDQTKEIQAMNIQLQIAGIKLKYLKDRAILAMLPHWEKFVQGVVKVSEKFVRFVKWIKDGATWGAKLTKIVLGLAAGFAAWVTTIAVVAKTISLVTAAVKGLQAALLLLTAHPVIAGLTLLAGALYLIADDIIGYNQGKDSVIGTIIKGLEDLDIKGYIDFPVPKWMEDMLIIIDFFKNGNKGINKKDLNIETLVDDPTSFVSATQRGQNAQNIMERVNRIKNSPFMTFNAKQEAIYRYLTDPKIQQSIKNSTDNRQISQNITIYTDQPVNETYNQFTQARLAFGTPGGY